MSSISSLPAGFLDDLPWDCMSRSEYHNYLSTFDGPPAYLNQLFMYTPEKNSCGEKLRNSYFYSRVIEKGLKGGGYFTVAKKAFNEAAQRGMLNHIVSSNYILAAGEVGDVNEAFNGLSTAYKLGVIAAETFNAFMKVAGALGRFDLVERVFNSACTLRKIDLISCNMMIELSGKNDRFDLAQAVYNSVMKKDKFTFSSYIKAAGLCGKFTEAAQAFKEAKTLKLANSYVYKNFIIAAGRGGQIEEAKLAFVDASERGIADKYVQSSYKSVVDVKGKK